eukprot:GEMP01019850.1.p1 GENE.GEMP01019850.1~~GEMP01019850.1.p1  ORF type:complete len:626 (+),score=96.12 GEMP01019850.1:316-2193(+)
MHISILASFFAREESHPHRLLSLAFALIANMAQVALVEVVLALYFQVLPHFFIVVGGALPLLFIPVVAACPFPISLSSKIAVIIGSNFIFGVLAFVILCQLDIERRVQFVVMAGVYRNIYSIVERRDKPRNTIAPRTLQEQLGERADRVGDKMLDLSASTSSETAIILQILATDIRLIAQDLRCTPDLRKVDISEFKNNISRYSFHGGQVDEETQRYVFGAHHSNGTFDETISYQSKGLANRRIGRSKTFPTRKNDEGSACHPPTRSAQRNSVSESVRQLYSRQVGKCWSLDLLALDEATHGHSMKFVGETLFEEYESSHDQFLDLSLAPAFLQDLEGKYNKLPYHSHIHGADMTNALIVLARTTTLWDSMEDVEKTALVIAGLAHDVGHPGHNNDFLKKTKDPLTLVYSDRSVLERMHCATLWQLLCEGHPALLAPMDKLAFWTLREWTLELILATDMKFHTDLVATYNLRLKHPSFLDACLSEADRLASAKICMKAADVGHSAKPWDMHVQWSIRVAKEFFAQGDAEVVRNLPISPGCMRPTLPKFMEGQATFLKILCEPLWDTLNSLGEHLCEGRCDEAKKFLKRMRANIENWQSYARQSPGTLPEALQSAVDSGMFKSEDA